MKKTSLDIHFHINSTKIIDADIITKELGIEPTKFYNIGDKKKYNNVEFPLYSDTEWTLSTGCKETIFGDNLLSELLDKLKYKTDVINRIITTYDASTRIDIVCYYSRTDKPIFSFSQEDLKIIYKLKAMVDFDFYDS